MATPLLVLVSTLQSAAYTLPGMKTLFHVHRMKHILHIQATSEEEKVLQKTSLMESTHAGIVFSEIANTLTLGINVGTFKDHGVKRDRRVPGGMEIGYSGVKGASGRKKLMFSGCKAASSCIVDAL